MNPKINKALRLLALLVLATLTTPSLAQSTTHPQTKPSGRLPGPAATPPTPAPGADAAPAPAASPRSKPTTQGAVEFGEAPYRVESAGLAIMLPLGSTAQSASAGAKSAAQIIAKDQTWMINIDTPHTSSTDATTADLCDQIVIEKFKAAGEVFEFKPGEPQNDPTKLVGVKGKLIEPRKPVTIDGHDADRAYFSVPGANPKGPAVVRGLTVIKSAANQFLVLELVTTETDFAKAKLIYETTVGTAHIEDPSRVNAERAAVVAAGRKAIASLGPTACEQVISQFPERWERRYKPAPTGADADAKELGYRRIQTMVGSRNQLNAKGGQAIPPGNGQQGYIVRIDARVIDSGYVIDSEAAYFFAPNADPEKTEESWTVRNAIRKDGKTDLATEIGARTGTKMEVNIEGTGQTGKVVKPSFQNDGYISRVEAWLLPQLLVKAGVATDFGFYSYQSEVGGVCLRRDTLEQPADRPGLWKLTSRLSDDKQPQTSFYNEKGELRWTELPDGSRWEPTTIEHLKVLWESKHMPMK